MNDAFDVLCLLINIGEFLVYCAACLFLVAASWLVYQKAEFARGGNIVYRHFKRREIMAVLPEVVDKRTRVWCGHKK